MPGDQTHGLMADGSGGNQKGNVGPQFPAGSQGIFCILGHGHTLAAVGGHADEFFRQPAQATFFHGMGKLRNGQPAGGVLGARVPAVVAQVRDAQIGHGRDGCSVHSEELCMGVVRCAGPLFAQFRTVGGGRADEHEPGFRQRLLQGRERNFIESGPLIRRVAQGAVIGPGPLDVGNERNFTHDRLLRPP